MNPEIQFFIYVYCNDLAEMKEFYSDLVGLDEIFYDAGPDGGLAYRNGGLQFTILPASGEVESPEGWQRQPGWDGGETETTSWSIQLPNRDEFDTVVERMQQADVPQLNSEPQWRGYWSFPVQDPMGHTVELTFSPDSKPGQTE